MTDYGKNRDVEIRTTASAARDYLSQAATKLSALESLAGMFDDVGDVRWIIAQARKRIAKADEELAELADKEATRHIKAVPITGVTLKLSPAVIKELRLNNAQVFLTDDGIKQEIIDWIGQSPTIMMSESEVIFNYGEDNANDTEEMG